MDAIAHPATQAQHNELLFAIEDLHRYTKLKRSHVYALIRAGIFPAPLKIGKNSRWLKTDIDRWVSSLQRQEATA